MPNPVASTKNPSSKMVPGLAPDDTDGSGIPKFISDLIAASSQKDTGDFDATKPPAPDSADDGIPSILKSAMGGPTNGAGQTTADVVKSVPKPLTEHYQSQARVQNPSNDQTSNVPPVIALASKIKSSMRPAPIANDDSDATDSPIPSPLAAAVKQAKDNANSAVTPVPPEIAAVTSPDYPASLSPIRDIAAPNQMDAGGQNPPILKESFGHKLKRELPNILTAVGAVGGALEAAGGPVGAEPHGAELLAQTLNARANRAIASRKLDIEQQAADTNEGYRRSMESQYGMVPVTIPDPTDPSKTTTVMVQQKDTGKYAGAATTAGQRERSATESNAVKLYLGNLKNEVESGKVAQYKPGVNPENGQFELQKLDKQGNSLGWVENSIVPSLIDKTSNTVEWKQMADGSYRTFPKQTTSGPGRGQPNMGAPGTKPGARVLDSSAADQNASASSTANPNAPAAGTRNNRPRNARSAVPPNGGGISGGANAQNAVIGIDPDGQQVLTAASDAPKYGLTQVRKVGQAEAEKVTNARSLMPVFNNPSPSDPGIVQLIDKLDQEGKLGVVASRWNEFLTGKVGAGDQDIEALRTKMGLAETGLMQVHVGARGSAALMEHFHDLVNSGRMNAETMRSGIVTELNYIKSKAMLPKPLPTNNPQAASNPYGFIPAK